MVQTASQPQLRLVGQWPDDDGRNVTERARLEVTKENRIAACVPRLDPRDPRWILAMQTQARLQGSTITPDHRQQLIRKGGKLGLRPFESNLIIAIVQDRARAGEPIGEASPTLRLVREPMAARTGQEVVWPKWVLAGAAGLAVATLLIRWLVG